MGTLGAEGEPGLYGRRLAPLFSGLHPLNVTAEGQAGEPVG